MALDDILNLRLCTVELGLGKEDGRVNRLRCEKCPTGTWIFSPSIQFGKF